eukprot:3529057-Rhodomonas_salina.2
MPSTSMLPGSTDTLSFSTNAQYQQFTYSYISTDMPAFRTKIRELWCAMVCYMRTRHSIGIA